MKSVLLIGAGGIARRHVDALGNIPTVRIAGVCDTNIERAEALGRKAGATAFHGAGEALDAVQPDYVAILTPRQVRAPLIELGSCRGHGVRSCRGQTVNSK